jgi:hypothetical protein
LEQQQELILNSVAEGIYGVDLAGRTTFVNRPLDGDDRLGRGGADWRQSA